MEEKIHIQINSCLPGNNVRWDKDHLHLISLKL